MTRKTIFEWAELFKEEITQGVSNSDIIQLLEDYKKEHTEKLILPDVVESVLCLHSNGYKDIEKSKIYELVDELTLDYVIIDGEGCRYRYPKELFELIK